jgi:hypothetical protein
MKLFCVAFVVAAVTGVTVESLAVPQMTLWAQGPMI